LGDFFSIIIGDEDRSLEARMDIVFFFILDEYGRSLSLTCSEFERLSPVDLRLIEVRGEGLELVGKLGEVHSI
jgi:hypothetical protein